MYLTLHVPNPWTGVWVKGRVGARVVRAHNTQHAFSLISYSAQAQARSPAWPFSVSELARASAVDISSAECRPFSSMRRSVACMLWARSADHPSSAATPFQKDAVKGPPRRRPSECDALRTPGRATPMDISAARLPTVNEHLILWLLRLGKGGGYPGEFSLPPSEAGVMQVTIGR